MFNDPFQPQSVTALQESPKKEAPKRPKSPPKSSEEWILSQAQEEQNQELALNLGLNAKKRDLQDGDHLTAAEAWPKRAPTGERLLEESERKNKVNMIFGSLEDIKDDIKRHARMCRIWFGCDHASLSRPMKIVCKEGLLTIKMKYTHVHLNNGVITEYLQSLKPLPTF